MKRIITTTVGLFTLSLTACSMASKEAGEAGAEPVGEARQAQTETYSFCYYPCNGYNVNYHTPQTTGFDALTMTNTLDQGWFVEGGGSWPSYSGLPATPTNLINCGNEYISFYSSWYCSQWETWKPEQIVYATATVSNGVITSCAANANTGATLFFSCATEFETTTYVTNGGYATTWAASNPSEFTCSCN